MRMQRPAAEVGEKGCRDWARYSGRAHRAPENWSGRTAGVELKPAAWLAWASKKKCHEEARARIETIRLASWPGKLGQAGPQEEGTIPTGRAHTATRVRPESGEGVRLCPWGGVNRPNATGAAQLRALAP